MKRGLKNRATIACAALLWASVLLPRFALARDGEAAGQDERIETFSHGPVKAEISIKPAVVDLGANMQLSLRITAPKHVAVTIPGMVDRLSGFVVAGNYQQQPAESDDGVINEVIYQLTPTISDEYRIAPIAVTYFDKSRHPPAKHWFPTRPIELERKKLVEGPIPEDVAVELEPIWVRPAFKTVATWVGVALGGSALLALIIFLLTRIRHEVAIRRMSPRERALRELDQLMRRDLIGKGEFKEFYVQLTMVVRRYIERAHSVRAPEQTTEEFLEAAANHPAFTPEVLGRLQAFLRAADLVKFAAQATDAGATDNATRTAREYIEKDQSQEPQEK